MTPPSFSDSSLPLAVVVAATKWDEPPRMRHHVTRQLMRWFNVLFVEFFPDPRHRKRTGFEWQSERLITYAATPRCSLPVRLYANDPFTHGFVNRRFARDIVYAASSFGENNRMLLLNFVYDFHEIMGQVQFAYSVYVCFDEFPRMRRRSKQVNALKAWYQAKLFQHYENQVARLADRCFTPHYPLREKLIKVNRTVDMLFHAHDFPVGPVKPPRPRSGTVNVCFAGYVNYRLLPEWLLAVSQSEDMRLHLVGPVQDKEGRSILAQPRVYHIPLLDKISLQSKLEEMDVLIMPYDWRTPEAAVLTTNSKIFQYIATGKPIVISNLPHYIDLPRGIIYKANSAEDFVASIRQAFAEDSELLVRERAKLASDNTWDKRGDMLYAIIQRDMEEKRQCARHA